jgi:hypothetical protein
MSEVDVTRGTIDEDVAPYFFWRWVDGFGVAFTRASVLANGITLRVYDLSADDPNTAVLTLSSLDPTSTTSANGRTLMYDTLQTDGWSADRTGYNAFYLPDISQLDSGSAYGGRVLRWEFEAQLASTLGSGIAMKAFETKIRARKSG